MPALQNIRRERFCCEVAAGQSLEKSYEIAGYTPSRKNAWKLRQAEDVGRRIAELLAEKERDRQRELKTAMQKAAITRADVMKRLLHLSEVAERDEQHGPAVRATELLGKELGMFIDRQLQKQTDDIFETLGDDELRQLVKERAAALERKAG